MAAIPLIAASGRVAPQASDRVYSAIERDYFSLEQPPTDLRLLATRALEMFSDVDRLGPTASQLENTWRESRDRLTREITLAPLFQGVALPFYLPAARREFSLELEGFLLPLLKESFESRYPGKTLRTFGRLPLANQMRVLPESRWQRLIDQRSNEFVAGWYFPTAFSGYAIPDQRAAMSRLPDHVVLSGPSEVAAALALCPDVVHKSDGKYGKLLALSAVEPASPEDGHMFWFFEAYGWDLDFNSRSMLGAVSEYFSGGLTVWG